MDTIHASVLLDEVVQGLLLKDGGRYLDCTCGLGGHSEAILEGCGPTGRLLAIDRDPDAIQLARGRLAHFGDRAEIVEGNCLAMHANAMAARPGIIYFGPSTLWAIQEVRAMRAEEGPSDHVPLVTEFDL